MALRRNTAWSPIISLKSSVFKMPVHAVGTKCIVLFGKERCWNSIPCGEGCQTFWKIIIVFGFTGIFAMSISEIVLALVLLHEFWDNKDIFIHDRLCKILMLTDNFFPAVMLIFLTCTCILCIWSIALVMKPTATKSPSLSLIIYHAFSYIVTLGVFLGSVYQFVIFFLQWPDATYRRELQVWMVNEFETGNPPNSISKKWLDTQYLFECCGVLSSKDWETIINSKSADKSSSEDDSFAADTPLPLSCCPKDTGDLCTEAIAWGNGCLPKQVDALKDYVYFNVATSCILYFLLDAFTAALLKYLEKFPAKSLTEIKFQRLPDEENHGSSEVELEETDPSQSKTNKGETKEIEEPPKAAKSTNNKKEVGKNIPHETKSSKNNAYREPPNSVATLKKTISLNMNSRPVIRQNSATTGGSRSLPQIWDPIYGDSDAELPDFSSLRPMFNNDSNLINLEETNTETHSDDPNDTEKEDVNSMDEIIMKSNKSRSDLTFSKSKYMNDANNGQAAVKKAVSNVELAMRDDPIGIMTMEDGNNNVGWAKKFRASHIGIMGRQLNLNIDTRTFPSFHAWKGLPSKSMNDS